MWLYDDKEFDETPEEYQGFVYIITNLTNNKKYIGKKFFWTIRKLPPLKGQKRKRTVKKQSDWKEYYGSSEELKNLVEQSGIDNYHRVILRLCKTKGECSYYEAKAQFENDVLLREEYYNEFIGCKIHSKHLKC